VFAFAATATLAGIVSARDSKVSIPLSPAWQFAARSELPQQFLIAPQRQMLPLINSLSSTSSGPHGSVNNATADMFARYVQ